MHLGAALIHFASGEIIAVNEDGENVIVDGVPGRIELIALFVLQSANLQEQNIIRILLIGLS